MKIWHKTIAMCIEIWLHGKQKRKINGVQTKEKNQGDDFISFGSENHTVIN